MVRRCMLDVPLTLSGFGCFGENADPLQRSGDPEQVCVLPSSAEECVCLRPSFRFFEHKS